MCEREGYVCERESRTNGVVFEHAHAHRCARAREGVEEARHGHGEEADGDDAGFDCLVWLGSCQPACPPMYSPVCVTGGVMVVWGGLFDGDGGGGCKAGWGQSAPFFAILTVFLVGAPARRGRRDGGAAALRLRCRRCRGGRRRRGSARWWSVSRFCCPDSAAGASLLRGRTGLSKSWRKRTDQAARSLVRCCQSMVAEQC